MFIIDFFSFRKAAMDSIVTLQKGLADAFLDREKGAEMFSKSRFHWCFGVFLL